MSSEIKLTKEEMDRITDLAASFVTDSNDVQFLRDAIAYDVKRYVEKGLQRRQEFFADPDAYERGIRP